MQKLLIVVVIAAALIACGDKPQDAPKPVSAPATQEQAKPNLTQQPDVGRVEHITVKATGSGVSAGAAINDALKTAVAQVNGVAINSVSAGLTAVAEVSASLDAETAKGKDSAKLDAALSSRTFAEQVVAKSRGLVKSFSVVRVVPPATGSTTFNADIEVQVAKFKGPADNGKIKIVVSPLRFDKTAFEIGDRMVPAAEVLGPIRQQIIDALAQTGRFTILDRQFEGELQGELNMIVSGKAVESDIAKLGQALSADLVWVGVVNDLTYRKQVRKLQTSDRELVGYSGGWSVSQRLINLATRQIQQATTLQGEAPAIAPTTLGAKFDESATLKSIEGGIVKKATEAIILRTFPVSVVERDGNQVVLSQGGQILAENARYHVYLQGKEIKDPQTGQSLGNMESLCCDVIVGRVTPNLSYGTLEDVKLDLANVQPGALQIRESVPVPLPTPKTVSGEVVSEPPAKKPAAVPAKRAGKGDDW